MLKIRLMPVLLFKEVGLVKGVRFDTNRRVGSAMQTVKVYNLRGVDELVFLDVMASRKGNRPDVEQIAELAAECFMPMTVGGGVRTTEDIRDLLQVGADKVAITTAAVETPEVIREGASSFGSQCIVVGIDARSRPGGGWEAFTHCGERATGLDVVTLAQRAEALGAGEILLTSIDRDGTMEGYDVELVRRVGDAVRIPVIASGGAGSSDHMADVLRNTRSLALAAGAMYHFTEQTPNTVKLHLKELGFNVRL